MSPPVLIMRSVSVTTLIVSALAMVGCATGPGQPPVVTPPPTVTAAPAIVTMAPIPNPEGSARPRAEHPASAAARALKHNPQHPVAAPAVSAAQPNPLQAARLRAAGLEQLNRGSIDRAVALLRQASQLDPSNKLIQRDLDRAIRIGQAVHAKR